MLHTLGANLHLVGPKLDLDVSVSKLGLHLGVANLSLVEFITSLHSFQYLFSV
jgi:hypothetical protein